MKNIQIAYLLISPIIAPSLLTIKNGKNKKKLKEIKARK
jgi:hypothetical protein